VNASADIAGGMWKGLQRSEHGGALFAGSSFGLSAAPTRPSVGGGRGSGAHAASQIATRKMADDVSVCGMGNVGAAGRMDEDDLNAMGWVKRRLAEREARARVEQGDNELGRKTQGMGKRRDWMDAGMSNASTPTASTAPSSTSTELTTPSMTPGLASRSSSVTNTKSTLSFWESRDLPALAPFTVTREHLLESVTVPVLPVSIRKDGHGHHVLKAVRLSPSISSSSHQRDEAPSSPIDTRELTSTNSFGKERRGGHPDEEGEQGDVDDDDDDDDDDEHEAQVSRPSVSTTTYKRMFYRTHQEKDYLRSWRRESQSTCGPRGAASVSGICTRVWMAKCDPGLIECIEQSQTRIGRSQLSHYFHPRYHLGHDQIYSPNRLYLLLNKWNLGYLIGSLGIPVRDSR